ncbi:MAG: sucrase ferredoxin [Cyanobacteria bacterium P01_E01_bin.42]
MLTQEPLTESLTECRFCSQVSQANGEDPIGTAGTADYWLLMELAQPWTEKTFTENPQIKPLIELFKQAFMKRGVMIRPVLIAPDPEYSQPGKTRILYYQRSQQQFAQFEKQEFIVPETDFPRLAAAILKNLMQQPNELEAFQEYRQDTSQIREILVCTHGNVDAACARFGYPIYQKLREDYATKPENGSSPSLRVWRCSHFGGHRFAPTAFELPGGRFWGHLEPEMLDLLVHHEGAVADLRSHYRGWAGLGKFEQVAEREIWMQEGWNWLGYNKYGRTTSKELKGIKRYIYGLARFIPLKQVRVFLEQWTKEATAAEVEIHFSSPDGKVSGIYSARVEESEPVMTASKSPKPGEAIDMSKLPQYRVSRLIKTATP